MKAKTIAALAIAAFAVTARAEFWSGNDLIEKLTSQSAFEKGASLGYIMGVADTTLGLYHCASRNVTAGQVQDIVKKYLLERPENRHMTADVIVTAAMAIAFPCPKDNKRGGGA